MVTSSHGFPSPDINVDNANQTAIQALADRMDAILSARTAAQITALSGVDLWAGEQRRQSDGTGSSTRQQSGLYLYNGSAWVPGVGDGRGGTSGAPTLTSNGGTNPNLGTSPTQEWDWWMLGPWCIGELRILWGTGAPTAGTLGLIVGLPVAASTLTGTVNTPVGSGYIRDASTGATNEVLAVVQGSGAALIAQGSNSGFVTGASPITLGAAGDEISLNLMYLT